MLILKVHNRHDNNEQNTLSRTTSNIIKKCSARRLQSNPKNREKSFKLWSWSISRHYLNSRSISINLHYLKIVEKPGKFRRRSGSMHRSSKPSNKSIKPVTQRRQRTGECGAYLKWNRRGCQSQCRLQAERNKRRVASRRRNRRYFPSESIGSPGDDLIERCRGTLLMEYRIKPRVALTPLWPRCESKKLIA